MFCLGGTELYPNLQESDPSFLLPIVTVALTLLLTEVSAIVSKLQSLKEKKKKDCFGWRESRIVINVCFI